MNRTTPLRRKAVKPKRKGATCRIGRCKRRPLLNGYCGTHNTQRLDRECRARVLERDKWRCRRCFSKERVQWAHVYSRRYRAIRWDERNSMALCYPCHRWQTFNPLEGEEFFRAELGEELMHELRMLALGREE